MMTQTTARTTAPQPLGLSRRPSPSEAMFDAFRAQDRPAFIGYMPYGFPDPETTHDALRTMVTHGVDAVEIGLPYTDPVMDGPVIQAASQVALDNGERMAGVFRAVETVANAGGVPLIMSYWNVVFHYGVERFARDLANAGGAGIITPDLIPDEAGEWIEASQRHGLDRIFPGVPGFQRRASGERRAQREGLHLRGLAHGRYGGTGHALVVPRGAGRAHTSRRGAERLRGHRRPRPPEQARTVGRYADGVIVGSGVGAHPAGRYRPRRARCARRPVRSGSQGRIVGRGRA